MGILILVLYNIFILNQDPRSIFKQESSKNLFAHNIQYGQWSLLKFCMQHNSHTALLGAKFQIDLTILIEAIGKRDFTEFPFYMAGFVWILYIVKGPWGLGSLLYL